MAAFIWDPPEAQLLSDKKLSFVEGSRPTRQLHLHIQKLPQFHITWLTVTKKPKLFSGHSPLHANMALVTTTSDTPEVWIHSCRSSQQGRETRLLPKRSEVLGGGARCLGAWGWEQERLSHSSLLAPKTIFGSVAVEHQWFTVTQQFGMGKCKGFLMKKVSPRVQLAPRCVHLLFL